MLMIRNSFRIDSLWCHETVQCRRSLCLPFHLRLLFVSSSHLSEEKSDNVRGSVGVYPVKHLPYRVNAIVVHIISRYIYICIYIYIYYIIYIYNIIYNIYTLV